MTRTPSCTAAPPGSASIMDSTEFRRVLGHFCSGVTVITSIHDGVPVGFACQSFQSLSLEPALVAFSVARTSTTWPRIEASGRFCVNMLSAEQERLCRDFAMSGGDKFKGVGWQPAPSGMPLLDGSLAWVDCVIQAVYEGGDHQIVVGCVEALDAPYEGEPLLFFRGGFGRFGA
ncbi:flavin reductase family protein [Streptomyces sp. NPDC002896]|uniref:flavin reductase family protein n=1 Tax=Streptomyces sp. NPDC002896 TaxID=3154438 RepID=UPI0033214904